MYSVDVLLMYAPVAEQITGKNTLPYINLCLQLNMFSFCNSQTI